MTINVLHLVLSLDTGGLENGVVNIINGLDDAKFRSVLCCIKHGGDLVSRINKNIKIIELKHYNGVRPGVISELRKIIREEKIDIIHTRNYKPYIFGFISGRIFGNASIVHSEHGKDYPFDKKKMLIQKLFSYKTNQIIALSSDIKNNMIEHIGINPWRIRVIMNGVDTDKFSPGNKNKMILDEFNINEGDIVVGAVGRLVKVKNYPELLIATRNAREINNRIKLVIVGDGPEYDSIKSLINENDMNNYVYLAGNRANINDFLRVFSIYVLTSSNEGISNTLLESMSTGLPVIVSSVGGNMEIVDSDNLGFKYRSGDNKQLTSYIVELSQNTELRQKLGSEARKQIINKYSLSAMIDQYSNLYLETYKKGLV